MPIVGLADCLANTLTPHVNVSGEVASQKLRDAFDAFSCTVKEMSIVRAYCVPSSESTTCQTCQQTKLPQKLLQEFVSKHQVAYEASWHASILDPEGVFTVKDFALTHATTFFWKPIREIINGKISCGDLAGKLSVLSSISEGLGRLLSPFADDLLPKIEHGVRIWEKFAAAEPLWRAFSIVVGYEADLEICADIPPGHIPLEWGIKLAPRFAANRIVKQIQLCIALFPAQHLPLTKHAYLSVQLQKMMDEFAKELLMWYDKIRARSMKGMMSDITLLASKASKIAKLVSDPAESVASGRSASSHTSCLSAHGGPHCFLPGHLFEHLQREDGPSPVFIRAKDLKKGTKIISADGTPTVVTKVDGQKANILLELEIDNAEPFITTPQHRIVTSDGGSHVMCSDGVEKMVIGKNERLVEEQEVLAITFKPDKPVTCFSSSEKPVVLSLGLTLKPARRGGADRRVRRRLEESEDVSMPDTAPGEYED